METLEKIRVHLAANAGRQSATFSIAGIAALVDRIDGFARREADLLEANNRYLERARAAEAGNGWPAGFEWIDRPVYVGGEDYQYRGQLLLSFPKEAGGLVRYIVRDQNRRLFIHNARQVGIDPPRFVNFGDEEKVDA